MFLSQAVLENALRRVVAASLSDNTVARSFASLRTLRSGGEVKSVGDMVELLQYHGYVTIESVVWPIGTSTMGSLQCSRPACGVAHR